MATPAVDDGVSEELSNLTVADEPMWLVQAKRLEKQLDDGARQFLRSVKVLIATPCYGGMIAMTYVNSSMNASAVMNYLGIKFDYDFIGTESLITRGRNYFAAKSIGGKYTHLLFIDADIGYPVDSIIKLLLHNRGVVAAVYPLKSYDWDSIIQVIRAIPPEEKNVSIDGILSATNRFVFNTGTSYDRLRISPEGVVKVLDVPTGFLLISTAVLKSLIDVGGVKPYTNDMAGYDCKETRGWFYDFFALIIDADTRRYLSEDYAFSRLCQKYGIDTFVDVTVPLTHMGVNMWGGRLVDSVRARITPEQAETVFSSSKQPPAKTAEAAAPTTE